MSDNGGRHVHTRSAGAIGVDVTHRYGKAFEIEARGHRLMVDQPVEADGADLGPTPTELFVASLAACAGLYAEGFLRRHGLGGDGLRVHAEATMSSELPARVARITLHLAGVPALPERRQAALLAVVGRCTVHNSIHQAPEVRIELLPAAEAAARV
ncbi:MAG TPA: OsmC family protein [Actinomycetes bacterium]|jgi:uncharacterized OsmC-like protein|nr:OsmC family protein [Actinomycetes bacterium]